MARAKKTENPPMPALAAESKTRPVRLDLSESDHDRLRLRAAKARLSMAAYARMVLMRAVEEEEELEDGPRRVSAQ